MAAVEVVFLSSSPPKVFREDVIPDCVLSSPNFPSPRELIRKKPQLRTGSRAAPIPENANSSFTSATALLLQQGEMENLEESKPTQDKGAQSDREMQDLKPANEPNNIIQAKKTRKPRIKAVAKSEAGAGTKEKPPRKSRAKKDNNEGQTKLPKKVTKASVTEALGKSTRKKVTETVSAHFAPPIVEPPPAVSMRSPSPPPIQEAMKRRTSWTPPRDTINLVESVAVVPSEVLDVAETVTQENIAEDGPSFASLLRNFGYNPDGSTNITSHLTGSEMSTKRKIIEPDESDAVIIMAQKVKRPKKKPRTITELATAAFRSESSKDTSALAASLLQYFPMQDQDSGVTVDGFKIPSKPRSRSPTKAASKASKSKKAKQPAEKLLSPQSALKQAGRQDFVFGTSSQLARENSPTLLRDLHMAMKLSNQIDDPFSDVIATSKKPSDGESQTKKKTSLWEAASMNDIAESMDVEVLDLVDSPNIFRSEFVQGISFRPSQALQNKEDTHSKEDSPIPKPLVDGNKDDLTTTTQSDPKGSVSVDMTVHSVTNNESEKAEPSTQTPKKPRSRPSSSKGVGKPSKSKADIQMPNYASYTIAQLKKEVNKYHFKAIKQRDAMVSLLEKCWESKQKMASGVPNSDSIMLTSPGKSPRSEQASQIAIPQSTPKKPRGRPAKAKSATTPKGKNKANPSQSVENIDIDSDSETPLAVLHSAEKKSPAAKSRFIPEEISDSDTPMTPSPPRRKASKIGSPPAPLEISTTTSEEGNSAADETSSTPEQIHLLHKHITLAITTAPGSSDPQNPSWHEKILLYDPIVLEDLTTWLNTGALEKVGWDGEVEPKDVKAWCWERGVCCLWRENLRGGARSRY